MSEDTDWLVLQLPDILNKINSEGVAFKEILRTRSLSCAVYYVPAGSREMETAHEADELYLVLSGKGRLRIGEQEHAVQEGTIMYVRASCDHTFFDIEEDLTAVALFGANPTD
jgi:mannose-6-phosphate isomerase-like protein (cupin superfamily)